MVYLRFVLLFVFVFFTDFVLSGRVLPHVVYCFFILVVFDFFVFACLRSHSGCFELSRSIVCLLLQSCFAAAFEFWAS